MSIRFFPPKSAIMEWKRSFDRGERILFDEMSEFVKQLRLFSQILSQYIENSNLKLRPLDAQELITHARQFFNPREFYKRESLQVLTSTSLFQIN